jgi:hypothetical protein
MRAWYAAGLLMLSSTISVAAQQIPERFARWEAAVVKPPRDSLQLSRGDYRYEGLAFGGLVFGALGAWLGSRDFAACPLEPGAECDGNENQVERGVVGGLVGAAVGGGLGYLVGRFSPKNPRPDSVARRPAAVPMVPDSTRMRVGYQHWRGAGIGSAIGAGVGVLLGVLAPTGCADCDPPSRGETILTVGLLGAGAGGLVGFLAGLSSPKYVWLPAPSSIEVAPE